MMTESQREALAVLEAVWKLSPDVRLGQLMAHLGELCEAHLNKGLADAEDDELIAILYRHRTELKARLGGATGTTLPAIGPSTAVSGSST